NLASTYSELGRLDEAVEMEKDVLNTRRQSLGNDHPDTITTMYNLAITLTRQGHHEDSLSLQS
ncbi:hypothetical protein LX36DRAFT_559999, partial [Colletotrichum falcatum]